MSLSPCYFTCTLDHAAHINARRPHSFKTINEFIDLQAWKIPESYAVAFPLPLANSDEDLIWHYKVFTFHDLQQGSISYGQSLSNLLRSHTAFNLTPPRTVALLCPSSVDFLFVWLGLMRLGYSVLLIAPQCHPSAISHLCKTCDVSILLYDDIHKALAAASAKVLNSEPPLQLFNLRWINDSNTTFSTVETDILPFKTSEADVAYLNHTSGTSTGLPKPIAQSHRAAVGVLPCLPYGHDEATFTTTPLYHGGIADCFRAWTSGALIWLFPGIEVPITASNVLKSFKCAQQATESSQLPPIKYFSSVPYVLQMVGEDDEGLQWLKSMEIVGVGGAALPQSAGDGLVEKGVNLISRFGSAECGFLLSSHRDYTTDKEWQYLRSRHGSTALNFEPRDDGLAELIVLSSWPHLTKKNRDDGSFATSDLFVVHSTIPDAWKYHSRADSQLTLITGKKFDPAPLEAAIATSPLLKDVLIFGNSRNFPGALLFRSPCSARMSDQEFLDELWPSINKLNKDGQGHTRLSKSMLIVMPAGAPELDKSSKGTILRGKAEEKHQMQIMRAYNPSTETSLDQNPLSHILDEQVPGIVLGIIKKVLNSIDPILEDVDLFSQGVDSVACMQVRAMVQKNLLSSDSRLLPLNVVYDCGTIKRLSRYIVTFRKGQTLEKEDEIQLMRDLIEEYSSFDDASHQLFENSVDRDRNDNISGGEVVILTGATGALGAHVLDQLRNLPSTSQIICLVRGASHTAAYARVCKSLSQRRKPPLCPSSQKVVCIPAKLGDPTLGLSPETYASIASRATIVIHAAWAVNFSMRLRSFAKDHIAGLRNLISLALHFRNVNPPRFLFCSSTASVLGPSATPPILESVSHDPSSASSLGYSRSKWVAEAICEQAYLTTRMRGNIGVLRIGQLCGDTQNGIWNMTEAWPLMLSSVKVTGALPALENQPLDWLPVDLAAKAVLQIASSPSPIKEDTPVYHLINTSPTPTWTDLLDWLKPLAPPFEIVSPAQWVSQVEDLTNEDAKHPARKLLGLWKSTYCGKETRREGVVFGMEETRACVPVMREVEPIRKELVERIWGWVEGEMVGVERVESG